MGSERSPTAGHSLFEQESDREGQEVRHSESHSVPPNRFAGRRLPVNGNEEPVQILEERYASGSIPRVGSVYTSSRYVFM